MRINGARFEVSSPGEMYVYDPTPACAGVCLDRTETRALAKKMDHCVRIPGTENLWRWICLLLLLGQCSTPTTVGYSNTEISYSSGLVDFKMHGMLK